MSQDGASTEDGISSEAKENSIYEPKEKPKLIRVLTVLAYMISVSMAAILLSIYYVFMWDAHPHLGSRTQLLRAYPNLALTNTQSNLTRTESVSFKEDPVNTTSSVNAYELTNESYVDSSSEIMQRLIAQRDTYDLSTNLPPSPESFEADSPREFVKRSLFFKKLLLHQKKHTNDVIEGFAADKQFT